MFETGSTFGGYRIDGILGRGGMGVVYEATQLSLSRRVALKIVAPGFSADHAFRERFRREGAIQARIDHPSIVHVYEAGDHDGHLFLAMRFVPGMTLKELVLTGDLDATRAVRLLQPIADALDSAHDAGLVHRDVKPQNILVDPRDRAYLADFGLTKAEGENSLTRSGHFVGTLDYISPEQVLGRDATPASDTYALAAVLYEVLTGTVPYARPTDAATLYAHVHEPAPALTALRPDLPADLQDAITAGLAKDPEDRPPTATALVDAAARALSAAPAAAQRPVAPREASGASARAVETRTEAPAVRPSRPSSRTRTLGETPAVPRAAPQPPVPAASQEAPEAPPEPDPPRARKSAAAPRPSRGHSRRATLLAGALAVPAIVVGYLLGHDGPEPVPGLARASAGSLSLSVPEAWRPVNAPAIPGLAFAGPTIARGPVGTRLGVVAGMVEGAAGRRLLPAAFEDRLAEPPAIDDEVRLGNLEARRYRGLAPRGYDGTLTLFVAPTEKGVAALGCFAARGEAASAAACDDVASTFRAPDALPLGPSAAYATRLGRTITALDAARRAGRDDLRQAKTRRGQAKVADGLAAAHRTASSALSELVTGPADRRAHLRLVRSLDSLVRRYGALAAAARAGDEARYESARQTVRVGDRELSSALEGFEALGYPT